MDATVRWIRNTAANSTCQLCTCPHDTLMLRILDDAVLLATNDGTNDESTRRVNTLTHG